MNENKDKYHDTVLDLEAKVKDNENIMLKIGRLLQAMFMLGPKPMSFYDSDLKHGLGYTNPYTLKKAISHNPKLYDASCFSDSKICVNVRDTEDILDDATKSQKNMENKLNDPVSIEKKQKFCRIDYNKLNALYEEFVSQKELSAEQKYFSSTFIPSENSSNASTSTSSSETQPSVDSMPSSNPMKLFLEKMKNEFKRLFALLQTNSKRESIFYTSPEEIRLTKFHQQETSPNKKKDVETNQNVIAPGMYKVTKQQEPNTKRAKSVLPSIGLSIASSVRRPLNRDSPLKTSVLSSTKKSSEKVEVSVRTNKKTYVASKNVVSNKKIVNDVDVQNDLKAKDVLCAFCAKNVLIPCHDKCMAKYKLNVHSNVRRTLFTTPRTVKSAFVDTTPVVSKTRFSIKNTQSKSLKTTFVVSRTKIATVTPLSARFKVVQIILWIVDSGCSKHMTGDHSLLKIFVEKFMGTVRFGNDYIAAITDYGDYVQGNITVCHVYYVEGLGHNLFSVGQFCDGDLEVAFRSNTCYVWNLKGVDFLIGARESNLYTISISDMAFFSHVCLLSKATSTKSWLWHRRLAHINFSTINDLTKHDLVDGLPKFKYSKDHLCSACERGKSKKSSHPPKLVPSTHSKLELLHMDLYGPMRVATINEKKYILVIVDDYSRFTWVYFLHTKDETSEIIKKFIAQVQLNYNAKVHKI
ncbi:integrase, catalytic region, zinc finger, CCHC-type containing protein [Tanacetum coccineum]